MRYLRKTGTDAERRWRTRKTLSWIEQRKEEEKALRFGTQIHIALPPLERPTDDAVRNYTEWR